MKSDLLHVLCQCDITMFCHLVRRADVVSVISASSLQVEGISACQLSDSECIYKRYLVNIW